MRWSDELPEACSDCHGYMCEQEPVIWRDDEPYCAVCATKFAIPLLNTFWAYIGGKPEVRHGR